MNFKAIIEAELKNKFPELNDIDIVSYLEKPKNPEFGDIALPCFRFAKIFRKPPVKIAEELELIFKENPAFEEINNVSGYLNFKYARKAFLEGCLHNILSNQMFTTLQKQGENKTMVIDFSSPNIAKKIHMGTFRSTVIGNSLNKIYKALGWNVVKINHLGDWGTQFGKLMTAYKKWGDDKKLSEKPMEYLQEIYIKFGKEAENNESLIEEARVWFSKLEQKDDEAFKMWELFRKFTIEDLEKGYKRVGVEFDHYWGEAFYEPMLNDMMDEIEKSEVSEISEGALVINLEKYNMPPCLIRKSNGTSIYATRDITAAKYRYDQFSFDKMLYVVGSPQRLHFAQVFKSLELLGYDWTGRCEFIGFGQLLGLSTRKGTAVYLDTIFDEARARILDIINNKNPELENKEDIADKIGIGAVIFQDLSKSKIKDSVFDWERVLSFEGETGPYVQYSYVRIFNILEKTGRLSDDEKVDYTHITDESSYALSALLSEFPKNLIMHLMSMNRI